MSKIVVLGSMNMDLVSMVDRLPKQGETMFGNEFFMASGGKGANQAVASAKQGVDSVMLGSVGTDPLSKEILEKLEEYNVEIHHVKQVKNAKCGVAQIFLSDGDNRIVIHANANNTHNMKELQTALKAEYQEGATLISQFEIPEKVIEEAFVYAKAIGYKTIFNAAPAKRISTKLAKKIDLLIVNEIEGSLISGFELTSMNDAENAAKNIFNQGIKAVLFTFGKAGSVYVDQEHTHQVSAFSVKAVDTTAAGDTFIGALAASMVKGESIEAAMQYASAASALTVQSLGAQPSIPMQKDVEEFLRKKIVND